MGEKGCLERKVPAGRTVERVDSLSIPGKDEREEKEVGKQEGE
jgi:hypothetical protein